MLPSSPKLHFVILVHHTPVQVAGDVIELERALTLAPRGQRADWVTRVQVESTLLNISFQYVI